MLDNSPQFPAGKHGQLCIVGRAFTQTLAGSIIANVFFKVWPSSEILPSEGSQTTPSPQWRLPRSCVNDTTTKQSAICRDRPPQINGACESALKEDIHGKSFQSDFDDGISCRNHHTRNVRGKS